MNNKLFKSANRCPECGALITESYKCKCVHNYTIKVIDLLIKIANNEELPKNIEYNGVIWKCNELYNDYYSTHNGESLFNDIISNTWIMSHLNTDIKIIEELEEIEDSPTISEEQALFNKLKHKDQEYILHFMKMLQPCERNDNNEH